ncbi:MAG: hypothetical protein FJ117_14615 [Deltaproteobacteria bacterium]|nr:hypothetical protein [Deltaproteobacteria bacterium]
MTIERQILKFVGTSMGTEKYKKMGKTLGQILVERNIISEEQLELALKLQKSEKGKYLGQILIEMGVPQEQINKVLDDYNKRKPIGQILVDAGIITPEQMEAALGKQKQLREQDVQKPLGMLLVEMGYATYQEYLEALSKHFNISIVSLKKFSLSPDLQKAVGVKYAQQNKIVVLENNEDAIKMALADPTTSAMDELKRIFPPSKKVEFYLASPDEIDYCLNEYFNPFALNIYR